MIAPKAAGAAGTRFGLHPVCASPFSFASRVAQDRIVPQRFPGYWNAKSIHFDEAVYMPSPKLKTAIGDSLACTGITINTNNGPAQHSTIGKDPVVRQACELGLVRSALIQVVYNGMYAPTVQADPPSSPCYFQDLRPSSRDPAKALALPKQAAVKIPAPVALTITNGTDIQQAGEVIQAMERDAGFDAKLRTMEFASSPQAGYGGDFQACRIGWSGRSDPDGNLP